MNDRCALVMYISWLIYITLTGGSCIFTLSLHRSDYKVNTNNILTKINIEFTQYV